MSRPDSQNPSGPARDKPPPGWKPVPLVCPQCKAQYLPLRPTAGRRVRCRHCKHVWRDEAAAVDKVSDALESAATAWSQLGSTMLAAADHGSTMGRIASKFARTPIPMPGEWVGKKLGRYEVRSVLGLGAMGHVYEAYDEDLQRTVALKILPRRIDPLHQPLGLRMFLQEARVAAGIQHPNVVTVYEIGQEGGIYYFVMERVHGITLATLVDQSGPLPMYQACYVIAHAAKGLAAGHALGVVHRDVKPGNIMIDTAGQVKVTDFGLANVSGAAGIEELAERTLGTPGWLSPEVARGERPTSASDIYSLGLTLYYALTKDRLVSAKTKSGMIDQQKEAKSIRREQLPADWPPRLCEILLQCLHADPNRRYQSADQLGTDLLRALVHDERDGTVVLEEEGRSGRSRGIARVWWGFVAVVLILLAILGVWLLAG